MSAAAIPKRKLAELVRSVSSGTVTTRAVQGAFPLYGSTGIIGRTNDGIYSGYSILVARVGANAGAVYSVDGQYGVTDNTLLVRPSTEIEGRFLEFYLKFLELNSHVYGSGQPLITGRIVKEIGIPELSRDAQAKISLALGHADALIDSLKRLIAKKRAIKQGMMQQLLVGKTRLPGFTDEWKSLRVAPNSHLKARIGWQGLTTAEYRSSGDYRLVGGTDFLNGRVDWMVTPYVDKWRFTQDSNIQLQIGDVLLTKDGTIGKVAFVDSLPGPATLNSGVFVLRPKSGAYHSGFLFCLLRSRMFEEFVAGLSAGSTISHLYQRDLVALEFMVPGSILEQAAIADLIFDADREIDALERRLKSTRNIKRGMMQELLTGRTRLELSEVAA